MRRVGTLLALLASLGPVAVTTGSLPSPATVLMRPRSFGLVAPLHSSRSANWAGYQQGVLEHGETYHQISATWRVPRATAHQPGTAESSALWVGVGGGCPDPACTTPAVDPTIIQAGTEHDVAADGTATYYAWTEMFPLPSVRTDLDVQPDDVIAVDIRGTNPNWTITIVNQTTGATFSTGVSYPVVMMTAEWVLEAPTIVSTAGPAPMPSVGGVQFEAARVNDHPADLDGQEMVAMVDTHGAPVAIPSSPGAGRDSFAVCQWTTAC